MLGTDKSAGVVSEIGSESVSAQYATDHKGLASKTNNSMLEPKWLGSSGVEQNEVDDST